MADAGKVEEEIFLLRAVGQGERSALEKIYELYSGILYATALKVLRDPADAQDVVQDVFIQIWEKAKLYDRRRGKPLTWAMTMTRNKAIDRLRSSQRRSRLKEEAQEELRQENPVAEAVSAEEVQAHEQGQIVRKAVQELNVEQRRAIELAFFSGLTQAEIAEALDVPLGTIKARIRRGLLKLRGLIRTRLK